MSFNPTPEQQAVVEKFRTGADIVVKAVAGAGKTSTLVLLAKDADTRDQVGVYVAYNKAIANEAAAKFPQNVTCKTAHAFAYAEIGKHYRARLNGERVRLSDSAKFLGLHAPLAVGEVTLSTFNQARIVSDMVAKFCKSADTEVTIKHLPWLDWCPKEQRNDLARHLLPYARKAWDDLQGTTGRLRFTHDHYLKLWQLHGSFENIAKGVFESPVLDADFVLFDEAQDANPVIDAVVQAQSCQKVMVGDQAQAIYAWNGAIDAMSKFEGEQLTLTQSFRFGEEIATVANEFLAMLGDPVRVVGTPSIPSTVQRLDKASAVLTRTNAGALQVALDMQGAGHKVHLVGGSSDLKGFAEGARDLQTKKWTSHSDLSIFKSWSEVQAYVDSDPDGTDLATMVRLVDNHGYQVILDVLDASVSEDKADVVISTAHKAKGREWDSVQIGADFARKIKKGESVPQPLTPEEIMLRYVAVTRAKLVLDPGPLGAKAVTVAA